MFFKGKKEDLYKAERNSHKFKKIISTLVMTGAIVGVTGNYVNALPATQKKEAITITRGNINKSVAKQLLGEYMERQDLINQYRAQGNLTEQEKQVGIIRKRMPGAIQKLEPEGKIPEMRIPGEIPGHKVQYTPTAEELADRDMNIKKSNSFIESLRVTNKSKTSTIKTKKANSRGSTVTRSQNDRDER